MCHQNKQHRKINKLGTESSDEGAGARADVRGLCGQCLGSVFLVLTGTVARQEAIKIGCKGQWMGGF